MSTTYQSNMKLKEQELDTVNANFALYKQKSKMQNKRLSEELAENTQGLGKANNEIARTVTLLQHETQTHKLTIENFEKLKEDFQKNKEQLQKALTEKEDLSTTNALLKNQLQELTQKYTLLEGEEDLLRKNRIKAAQQEMRATHALEKSQTALEEQQKLYENKVSEFKAELLSKKALIEKQQRQIVDFEITVTKTQNSLLTSREDNRFLRLLAEAAFSNEQTKNLAVLNKTLKDTYQHLQSAQKQLKNELQSFVDYGIEIGKINEQHLHARTIAGEYERRILDQTSLQQEYNLKIELQIKAYDQLSQGEFSKEQEDLQAEAHKQNALYDKRIYDFTASAFKATTDTQALEKKNMSYNNYLILPKRLSCIKLLLWILLSTLLSMLMMNFISFLLMLCPNKFLSILCNLINVLLFVTL